MPWTKQRGQVTYDARSLCHKVVVGFEKTQGNLFGLSNEPFVNKPARHPEHKGDNPQLRNTVGAKMLHDALEQAQVGTPAEVYQGLVHILRVGAEHAANEKQVKVIAHVNVRAVMRFIDTFLKETDGGARLVGVWGAFMTLLSEHGEIRVYSPNAPDSFGKTAGDVEIYYDDVLVSASECKQRPVNLDDVKHGVRKALAMGISEYHFVVSVGMATGQEAAIAEAIRLHSEEVDSALVDIWEQAPLLAALLNPTRRAKFGLCVVKLLRDMRKFESANVAAEIWGAVTS